MTEIWKDVHGYEGCYQVSNLGNVKSLSRIIHRNVPSTGNFRCKERILKTDNVKGYLRVTLSNNKKKKRFFIHRLVAIAFIENKYDKPFVNHIDSNPLNNKADNLEWCTQKENIAHGFKYGNMKVKRGEQCNLTKISDKDALEIISRYKTGNYTQQQLANEYNISRQHVSKLHLGIRRKELNNV